MWDIPNAQVFAKLTLCVCLSHSTKLRGLLYPTSSQPCQVHMAKLQTPHCYFAKLPNSHCPSWPFLFANATVPNCKADIAQVDIDLFCQCHSTILQCQQWRTSRQHCQVCIPKLPTSHCYFAKLPSLVYPVELMPEWASSWPQILVFLGRQRCEWSAQTFAPENQIVPVFFFVFFTGNLGLCPSSFHFHYLLSLFIAFVNWWVFEAWKEPFQNSNYFLNYFLNILRANWI
jgi:hypothetical protein